MQPSQYMQTERALLMVYVIGHFVNQHVGIGYLGGLIDRELFCN